MRITVQNQKDLDAIPLHSDTYRYITIWTDSSFWIEKKAHLTNCAIVIKGKSMVAVYCGIVNCINECKVYAHNKSIIYANGYSRITAFGESVIHALDKSHITAGKYNNNDAVVIHKYNGFNGKIEAYGNTKVLNR